MGIVPTPGCQRKFDATLGWIGLTFAKFGVWATAIVRYGKSMCVGNPGSMNQTLTCNLPKLIRHRKVPILEPPFRQCESSRHEADNAHGDEKPKYCPKINRRQDRFQVLHAPGDFFPDQTYAIFDGMRSQRRITRCSKTNLVRQRQKIVVKQDCAGAKDIILRKTPLSAWSTW